jgi:hypothetical protein
MVPNWGSVKQVAPVTGWATTTLQPAWRAAAVSGKAVVKFRS